MRVLLADDERHIRSFLSDVIIEWGYKPVIAEDGAQAKEVLYTEEPPQIVILDWLMPNLNGIDLCRELKNSPIYKELYIILLTGQAHHANIQDVGSAGFNAFISKPIDLSDLRLCLELGARHVGYIH